MEQRLAAAYEFLLTWFQANVLTWNTAAQWVCVALAYVLTALAWRGYERRLLERVDAKGFGGMVRAVVRAVVDVGNVAAFVVVLEACAGVFRALERQPGVLGAACDVAVAWIVIRLLTSIMPNRALARGVVSLVWAVAALSVFGLLSPITDFLGGLRLTVGGTSFSALGVIKGVVLAVIFLQAASLGVQFVNRRIATARGLSPSLQVLLAKGFKLALYTSAVLVAMSWVGIDLTSLAIFSSALGVGIGFGLKTIFSNYVAGVLLLMDRSIKPGDTIEVGGVFGVVRDMQGRYTSILARNGKEYLIPNEQLITGEVVNWTYTDRNIRLEVPVGIAYESDLDKAMALLPEAAGAVPRVLASPPPAPRLVGFGDNSVNLELRFWIADAEAGLANVESDVLVRIWHLFHENGIAFPFPQRDVLLKPDSTLTVKLDKETDHE
ncbi:mechanosensitive ion channel domain-containing protein [Pseudodesulfovibrio sp.]|uniref:mechanosensitive ion channel family protein n=1 Tax=Pseudodesulfovibrio sp. TaxID=2035812 RepID=UPI0026399C8A|nr:mechanosensitive ion channel domain-containing protein [Pseudodesulfovibrio sp.]MDD3311064.1 mechanosensitive ion channel [Pseudodesulfovibrio sp.]